jgi:hypothetical protein
MDEDEYESCAIPEVDEEVCGGARAIVAAARVIADSMGDTLLADVADDAAAALVRYEGSACTAARMYDLEMLQDVMAELRWHLGSVVEGRGVAAS